MKSKGNPDEVVAEMRRQLEAIFDHNSALYMTGDICGSESMIGLWEKQKPRFAYNRFEGPNASFTSTLNADGEFEEDDTYDVPWCIDLCSGEMELPTLDMKFTLEEWAVM